MKLNKIENGMQKAAESIDQNFRMLNYEDSGWITLPLKNGATGNVSVRRIDNVVYLKIVGLLSTAGSQPSNIFATLPEEFRDKEGSSFVCGSNSLTGTGIITLDNNGNLFLWSTNNVGATKRLLVSYLVD